MQIEINGMIAECDPVAVNALMASASKIGQQAAELEQLCAERDDLAAKLATANAELHELRIKAHLWESWEDTRARSLSQETQP